jgi:hypothetical protein
VNFNDFTAQNGAILSEQNGTTSCILELDYSFYSNYWYINAINTINTGGEATMTVIYDNPDTNPSSVSYTGSLSGFSGGAVSFTEPLQITLNYFFTNQTPFNGNIIALASTPLLPTNYSNMFVNVFIAPFLT